MQFLRIKDMRNDKRITIRLNSRVAKLIMQLAEDNDVSTCEFIRSSLENLVLGTAYKDAFEELLNKAEKNGNRKNTNERTSKKCNARSKRAA